MTKGAPPRTRAARVGAGWARERLWLGMSNVGFWVVLALAAVALGVPSLGLGSWDVLGWAALVLLAQLPFDVVGGLWLPRRHGRSAESTAGWAGRWLRAASLHALLMASALGAAVGLHALGGAVAVLLGALAGIVGLIGLQGPWLWLTTGLRTAPAPAETVARAREVGLDPAVVKVVDARDGSFVGGWLGLPGAETLVLPAAWTVPGAEDVLDVQLRRRAVARRSGQRVRGVVLGVGWTLFGLALGLALFGADDPSAAIRAASMATLWSFVGLLLLPTPSRAGVLAVDRAALRDGLSAERFVAVARGLDEDQEDEPKRAEIVESIFHPIPALERRIEAAHQHSQAGGAWHAARMALLASQAVGCPLARAVHCNAGRPELWAVYPGD